MAGGCYLWSMGAATLVSDDYDEAVELAAAMPLKFLKVYTNS